MVLININYRTMSRQDVAVLKPRRVVEEFKVTFLVSKRETKTSGVQRWSWSVGGWCWCLQLYKTPWHSAPMSTHYKHQSKESSYKHRTHYIKAPSCCCFSFFFFFTLFSSTSQHFTHTAGYFLTSIFPPSPDCDYSYIFVSFWRLPLEMKRRALDDEGDLFK